MPVLGGIVQRRGMAALIVIGVVAATTAAAAALVVDQTPSSNPPTITMTAPLTGKSYGAASWAASCSGGGICGTAADKNGVARVTVAVKKQGAGGRYWNGTGFTSNSAVHLVASGTTSWRLAMPLPADGGYDVWVIATDGLGNASDARSIRASFTTDTSVPAAPILLATPPAFTELTDVVFQIFNVEPGGTLRCSLDGLEQQTCASVQRYSRLPSGEHCIEVVAVDAALNVSPPARYCWNIVTTTFPITGDLTEPFFPGTSQPIDLRITNTNSFTVTVTGVDVTVQDATTRDGQPNPGCIGSEHFQVVQQLRTEAPIPGGATRRLSELGVPQSRWPVVEMLNLPVNQDACQGTSLTLTYRGTAR